MKRLTEVSDGSFIRMQGFVYKVAKTITGFRLDIPTAAHRIRPEIRRRGRIQYGLNCQMWVEVIHNA